MRRLFLLRIRSRVTFEDILVEDVLSCDVEVGQVQREVCDQVCFEIHAA